MSTERIDPLTSKRSRGGAQTHPIYWLGLQWAVTAEGVESRDGTVVIEAARLWEDDARGWAAQMADWPWIDRADFNEALAFARNLWPRDRPQWDGLGLALVDAHAAWCPDSPVHRSNRRRGHVVVGRRQDVSPEIERGHLVDRMPLSMRLCAANGLQPRTQAERVALLFIAFNTMTVRDRLDPQVVHRAFLAIDEYRLCMAPDMREPL